MRIIKRKRVPTNENMVGAESETGAETKSRKSHADSDNDNQNKQSLHAYFMPPPPVPPESQLEPRLNDISNSSQSSRTNNQEKSQQVLTHSSYYSLTPTSSSTSLHDLNQSGEQDKNVKSSKRRSLTKTAQVVKKKRGRPPKNNTLSKTSLQKGKLTEPINQKSTETLDKVLSLSPSSISSSSLLSLSTITSASSKKSIDIFSSPLPRLTWANAHDLWQIMRNKDSQFKHDNLYLKKHLGIEAQMRAILIDWLIEIAYAYRLHRETLHLALEYMDRFLTECKQQMRVDRLQLIGMTSLFLASKVEEIYPPKLKELASHMENYSNNNEEAISQFELFMLKTLNWQISPVTCNTWLMTYLQIAAINYHTYMNIDSMKTIDLSDCVHNTHIVMPLNVYKNSSSNPSQQISAKQQEFYMKNYMKCITLLDLCLFDMDSMKFKYSMLAASAMYHMLCKPTSCQYNANSLVCNLVQLCSGYSIGELDACIRWMAPYADVCKEVLGDDKMTTIKQFSSVEADDAHNIQLYYPNLDLMKEAEIRKTPSKFYPNTNSNILTPPESNRKNHQ